MDVVSDEGDHLEPIELMVDILDHLGDTGVPSQAMVMVRVQDIQSDVWLLGT